MNCGEFKYSLARKIYGIRVEVKLIDSQRQSFRAGTAHRACQTYPVGEWVMQEAPSERME